MQKLYVTGYYDDQDELFHGSETQGPGVVNPADNPDTNARCWDDLDDALLAFCHRDEDDAQILRRWNQPDDVLDELDSIEAADERAVWVERMTAFRRTQLHRLLTDYFGTDEYRTRQIVLSWKQVNGRWVPEEQMNVLDWIASRVEEKGSRLAGFSSCAGTIRSKLARRRVAQTGEAWWRTYNLA